MLKMTEEGNTSITEQVCFSGPLTVAEIRKCLSVKTRPEFIERRATISDSEPSRKIYPEFPVSDCFVREHFFENSANDEALSFTSQSSLPNDQNGAASSIPTEEQTDPALISSGDDQSKENVNKSPGGVEAEESINDSQENDDLVFNSSLVHSAMSDVPITLSNSNHHDSAINLECDEHSLDESSSSQHQFNDTIEEMETALRKGLNYLIPGDTTAALNTPQSPNPHLTPPTTGSTNSKTYKSRIPISSTQTKTHKRLNFPETPLKPDLQFKIPSKPVTQRKTPNFKNIVSPVGIYIRNSPRVAQVQHIVPKPLTPNSLWPKSTGTNRLLQQDGGDLPCRLYKPAKRTIIAKGKELTLPDSIQKLIPHTPEIIKHEGRRIRGRDMDGASVEAKLLGDDLTGCFEDSSLMNSSM